MLAHALLAAMTVAARAETPSPQGLIALTANEIRHLFSQPVNHTQHGIRHLLRWSRRLATKAAQATATTAVRRSNSPDHELRLEY